MEKIFKIISIKSLNKVNEYNQVASHINYEVTAIDNDISVLYQGMVSLPLPTDSFTEFSDLTEDQVIHWVKNTINQEKLNELLEKLINRKKYGEPMESTLPWND